MSLTVAEDRTLKELRRANFRTIEKELYHYPARKREFERMRADILYSTPVPDVPASTGPGDPTANKVMHLQSGVLLEIARRLEAIEYAIKVVQAHEEKGRWELVRLKYFEQRLTNQGIMQRLNIGHDTFYRWRREFIELIADRLGWEV